MENKKPLSAIEVYEALPTESLKNIYMTMCVIAMNHEIFCSTLDDYAPKDDLSLLTLYCQRHHRVTGDVFCVEE